MKVSVVIPVYNRPEELRRALNSVIAQTIQDFEVFIVDDRSDIELKSVVDQFGDQRLHYIRLEEKGNANVCRNRGILESSGEYIALLDSDDEWESTHLELSIRFIEESQADGVYSGTYIFDGETKRFIGAKEVAPYIGAANYLMSGGIAQTSSLLVKRSCAHQVLFDESLRRHQDYDFFIRFSDQYVWTVKWTPTCIVHWKKGEQRNRDISSELKFMYKYQTRFSKRIWIDYFKKQYSYFLNVEPSEENRAKYKTELLRHIAFLSYTDFCQIQENRKGTMGALVNWIDFNWRLMFKRKGA